MTTSEKRLQVSGLNQFYGQSHTLWDVDLTVPDAEITVIMGRNGVGKTTLLKCIMGLLPFTATTFEYRDDDIRKLSTEQRALMGMGYVPQGRQIFPLLSVEENLRTGLFAAPRAGKNKDQQIPQLVFELFPVLHSMRRRRGGDLSGGQQQQLAIARALVTEPQLLILDEPTEGIQPNIVADIASIVQTLRSELKLTVLLVEQKLAFARRVGDHFVILDRGRGVANGAMDGLDDKLVETYLTV